ncbi:hypothetical protein ACE6H2_005253 [Prunus campanulata]
MAAEEGSSWDLVNENDLWEDEESNLGEEDYVLPRQEDMFLLNRHGLGGAHVLHGLFFTAGVDFLSLMFWVYSVLVNVGDKCYGEAKVSSYGDCHTLVLLCIC